MEQEHKPPAKPPRRRQRPSAPPHSNPKPRAVFSPPAWLKQNTGSEITSIGTDDLEADPSTVDSSSGSELLCSYNWQDAATPTIYVPGAPPKWTPQKLPATLQQDKGGRFIDQNAHRCPRYPFEPLFKAVNVMKPDTDFSQVDFITNRNSLRKLLDFVRGKAFESFRIDLDMIRDTLVITRKERRTRENKSGPRDNLGFGSNFEHGFTVPQEGLENSTGHHRATKYKLGDLTCVVRYEVDAFLAEEEVKEGGVNEERVNIVSSITEVTQSPEDDLLVSLKGLSLHTEKQDQKSKGSKSKDIAVISKGTEVASTRLLELKTKSKSPVMSHLVPQLWFGRVPFLIVGIHSNGTFHKLSITNTAAEFLKFENSQQDRLQKLVHLIKLLKKLTMSTPEKACIVVCEPKIKPVKLSIFQVKDKKQVLPDEVVRSHWGLKGA